MTDIEFGEVVRFFQLRRYGFVRPVGSDLTDELRSVQVFFHLGNICGVSGNPWEEQPFLDPEADKPSFINPLCGVAFVRETHKDKQRCRLWAPADLWEAVECSLRWQPAFRVVRIKNGHRAEVVWQQDPAMRGPEAVRDLARHFPRTGEDELSLSYREVVDTGLALDVWRPADTDPQPGSIAYTTNRLSLRHGWRQSLSLCDPRPPADLEF